MALLSAFGAYSVSIAGVLAVSKPLAFVAAQRVWDIWFDADVHVSNFDSLWRRWSFEGENECVGWFQLFVSFCQSVCV